MSKCCYKVENRATGHVYGVYRFYVVAVLACEAFSNVRLVAVSSSVYDEWHGVEV